MTPPPRYRVVQRCVIDSTDGSVLYEPLPALPARAIADALNALAAEGVPNHTHWRLVEHRLVQQGLLPDARS